MYICRLFFTQALFQLTITYITTTRYTTLQMLRLQKVLQVKTHMRVILESSRLRLSKEFGADNKALEHVSLFTHFTVHIYLHKSYFASAFGAFWYDKIRRSSHYQNN